MKGILVGFNATILANLFNPSIFRESWFLRAQLLEAEDIQAGFIFTNQIVQLPTRRFTLLVVPQQLQFSPGDLQDARVLVPDVLGRLVGALPHTPFTAVGINFLWHLDLEGESVDQVTRRLFSNPQNPVDSLFSSPDAQFGAYMSKEVVDARLKLDMKPVQVTIAGLPHVKPGSLGIACTFNFHRDVADDANAAQTIQRVLSHWADYEGIVDQILVQLVGRK